MKSARTSLPMTSKTLKPIHPQSHIVSNRKRAAANCEIISQINAKKPCDAQININDLSKKTLAKIFGFLDVDSLKEVAVTCRKWKAVLEGSVGWTMKMYNKLSASDYKVLLETNRVFTSLCIYNLQHRKVLLPYQPFASALNNCRHGTTESIKSLTYFHETSAITVENANILLNTFIQLQNLTKIVLLRIHGPRVDMMQDTAKPAFKNLEILMVEECDIELLAFFSNVQLKDLSILNPVKHQSESQKLVWNFLSSQERLEELDLSFTKDFDEMDLFRSPLNAVVNFELREFSLKTIKNIPRSNYKNVMVFLSLHADTLNKVQLGRKFPDFIYSYLFAKLKKLKTIYLMANDVPTSEEFFAQLQDNSSVKNLILSHHVNAGKANECSIKLIKHLPRLESLRLLMPYTRNVQKLLANYSVDLKHLKSVFFEVPYDTSLGNLELPNVESVEVHCSKEKPAITHRASNCLNRKLQSLHYNGPVDTGFCDVVKQNYPNLKKLEICNLEVQVDHLLLPPVRELRLRDDNFFVKDDIYYEHEYLTDSEDEDDD